MNRQRTPFLAASILVATAAVFYHRPPVPQATVPHSDLRDAAGDLDPAARNQLTQELQQEEAAQAQATQDALTSDQLVDPQLKNLAVLIGQIHPGTNDPLLARYKASTNGTITRKQVVNISPANPADGGPINVSGPMAFNAFFAAGKAGMDPGNQKIFNTVQALGGDHYQFFLVKWQPEEGESASEGMIVDTANHQVLGFTIY